MDSSGPILVIGGTGRHGGTGTAVIRALRAAGRRVRALVRTRDARAGALEALGAEVVSGDLLDRRTLLEPLQGVHTAYFTYPVAAGIVEAAAHFSSAARATGLKRLVVMSMGAAHPESPSALGRAQWLAEELFVTAGFACLHLRIAAFFFENLGLLHGKEILAEGVIRNSFADIKVGWMAGEDAGKLAVAALLHPERFAAAPAVYASGGESLSHAEIAALLGRRLAREIRHETIPEAAWRDRLLALGSGDARINADMAGHIAALGAKVSKEFPLNPIFETAVLAKPILFAEFLHRGDTPFG